MNSKYLMWIISDMQPTSGIVTHVENQYTRSWLYKWFLFLLDKLSISQALIQPYKAVIVRLVPWEYFFLLIYRSGILSAYSNGSLLNVFQKGFTDPIDGQLRAYSLPFERWREHRWQSPFHVYPVWNSQRTIQWPWAFWSELPTEELRGTHPSECS